MKTRLHLKWQTLALVASLLGSLWSCDKVVNEPNGGQQAGGSDEIDTRMAVDRTGKPVVGARIALVKAGDSTGQLVALNATGISGKYPTFNVPDGNYSAILRDPSDSFGKYIDTLKIQGGKVPAARDTLLSLGKVRGVVKLVGHEALTSVTVGLLATDIAANVKKDGSFEIDLVPGGLFTLVATTTLEGYGPYYRRIQLKDGQILTISDTLVLPVTGLMAPAELKVLQDTTTGNVNISWTRVDHPDLMGYVLEKVEAGSVTSTKYLTDTVWTDSLGRYWEGLPLLGPWPSRDVAYRVRSRSLSGAPDSRNVAQAFIAKPPVWTKGVDSVRVTMTTDSVTGVTTLKWNTPNHPDVVGWRVIRTDPNTSYCQGDVLTGTWNDSICGDPRLPVVSVSTDSGKASKLYRPQSPLVAFAIQALRRNGGTQDVASTSWQSHSSLRLVQWRDSASGLSSSTVFSSFGGWILWSEVGRNSKVSRDGSSWEEIPDQADGVQWIVTGQGDSLWMARVADDLLHVVVASRTGRGTWAQQNFRSGDTVRYLSQAVVVGGRFAVLMDRRQELYRTGPGDSLVAVPGAIIFNFGSGWSSSATLPDSGWMIAFSSTIGHAKATIYQGDQVRSWSRNVQWGSPGTGFWAPIGDQGGYLFDFGKTPAYFSPTNDGWLLAAPGGGDTWNPQTATVFHDEIWTIVDGHLWKGKLNLPK